MKPIRVRLAAVLLSAALATTGLTACGSDSSADGVTLRYWMWDSAQMPGYRQCATDFEAQNPGVHIQLDQYGWADYWTQLTASMVAENAPDVFVNHTSRFGTYASLGQLLDMDPYAESDGYDLTQFEDGLAGQWVSQGGEQRYGLPKDWDTEALFYNTEMLAEAGYTADDVWSLEWNPDDGGTYEKFLAHMTIDKNGVRGDEPGFDKTRIAVYGTGYNEAGSGYGQVQWSPYALSNGEWRWTDTNPWGTVFNYDDPNFQTSIGWWRSLIDKGYMPSLAIASSGVGSLESLKSGAYATLIEGSWNMAGVATTTGVGQFNVIPTPIGPDGNRASVQNGLADSIWIGTEHPDEAWAWVSYMGTSACQNIIADQAVVFPAIASSSDRAAEAFKKLGYNADAFSVHITDGTAVTSPVVDRWAQVDSIMDPAMSAVLAFQADPASLTDANSRVNEMMARDRDD
ncbi:sugar ABC transporter substrate-binding protein [Brooklawnia sp.]|uniref:ABC transporter substrate-binding protein n=1 Tax=Brooklawnia sp. TaxID=2699740 RepID=UPI00311E34A0